MSRPVQTKTIQPKSVVLDEALIRAHQVSVWRFLRFLGAPPAVADDLTQETFLSLLRRPPDDDGPEALARWLRRVAHNAFVSQHRRLRRELASFSLLDLDAGFVELSGASSGEDYLTALDACMATLGQRERELVKLRYTNDENRTAIAKHLDLSEEATKSLLRRVKDRLRHCIQKRLNDDS
ncbi:MAG: sigma-70 family RNA polymerase sigma factor [bacterium]|nr:sigma-70 family RNA polymerase sigma factor [bacterium]